MSGTPSASSGALSGGLQVADSRGLPWTPWSSESWGRSRSSTTTALPSTSAAPVRARCSSTSRWPRGTRCLPTSSWKTSGAASASRRATTCRFRSRACDARSARTGSRHAEVATRSICPRRARRGPFRPALGGRARGPPRGRRRDGGDDAARRARTVARRRTRRLRRRRLRAAGDHQTRRVAASPRSKTASTPTCCSAGTRS